MLMPVKPSWSMWVRKPHETIESVLIKRKWKRIIQMQHTKAQQIVHIS